VDYAKSIPLGNDDDRRGPKRKNIATIQAIDKLSKRNELSKAPKIKALKTDN
jgi:hypothetical protein